MGDLVKTDAESLVERVVVQGDLAKLTPGQRAQYYARVCESLGLNPLTRPFEYIMLNGRLTLYARRDATDQLRKIHGVSVEIVSREHVDDLYIVVARATDREGRRDEAIGAVSVVGLRGEALANAIMKAETKAKRRVTLSLVGLGWLDEMEIETVPEATPVPAADAEGTAELEPPSSATQPHWIDDEGTRRRFWAWAGSLGLDREAVHQILGVSSLREFHGSKQEAAQRIQAWVDAHAATVKEGQKSFSE